MRVFRRRRRVQRGPHVTPSVGAGFVYWAHRIFGPDSDRALIAMSNQVMVLRGAGELEEAAIVARSLLARSTEKRGAADERTLKFEVQLVDALGRLRRFEEADLHARHVLQVLKDHDDSATATNAADWHGRFLLELGRPKEAEPFLRRAAHGFGRLVGADAELTLDAWSFVARALMDQSRDDEAVLLQRELAARYAESFGEESARAQHAQLLLAGYLRSAGEHDEALRIARPLASAAKDPNDARVATDILRSLTED